MSISSDMIRSDPFMAGQLQRYHTWPVLHRQTLAEHQWGVSRILLQIWPDAPKEVVQYALFHDMGEIRTGDLPFPVKQDCPELVPLLDVLEEKTRDTMTKLWYLPTQPKLPLEQKAVVKLCDMIEMWEFGLFELLKGNRLAVSIISDVGMWLGKTLRPGSTKQVESPDTEWYGIRSRAIAYVTGRARMVSRAGVAFPETYKIYTE